MIAVRFGELKIVPQAFIERGMAVWIDERNNALAVTSLYDTTDPTDRLEEIDFPPGMKGFISGVMVAPRDYEIVKGILLPKDEPVTGGGPTCP